MSRIPYASRLGAIDAGVRPVRWGRNRPEWVNALILNLAWVGPLLLAGIVQRAGWPIFWPVYVLSLLAMVLTFWALRARPALLVMSLIGWFAAQSFVTALAAPSIGPQAAAWLHNYKEAMYLALFSVGAATVLQRTSLRPRQLRAWMKKLHWTDFLALGFLALVTLFFVVGLLWVPTKLESELVYARRFASLPVIFLAGRCLTGGLADYRMALSFVVGVGFAIALFGIIERVILGDAFWTDVVQIGHFRASLAEEGFASDRARLIQDIPANWTSFFDGVPVRRLVSTFLEPTTLALFLTFAIAVASFALPDVGHNGGRSRRIVRLIIISTLVLALVLTLGKGGALALAVIVAAMLLRMARSNAVRIGVLIAAAIVAAVLVGQLTPLAHNISRHVEGMASGVAQVLEHPMGTGLGSTGFWGERGRIGTDSTLGAVASQTGILGAALYVGWLLTASWRLLPQGESGATQRRLMAAALLGLLCVAVLSNSASGLLAGFAYVLFAGWAMSITTDRGPASRPERAP